MLAWEREQELVSEGKGTRDWSLEQQKDILDPNKGKAYDENGRAFEGQHMKSAMEYPEYQGDPNNIQFLTRKEHLEAHKGSWQNPTNWYYNPETKDFLDFGNGEIIPCKIIELTGSITNAKISDINNSASPVRSDIVTQVINIVEEAKRSSPKEHTVAPHEQHYHTKNGPILKEKKVYPRGGKKD